MLCADLETSTEPSRLALAAELRERQLELLSDAAAVVAARLPEGPRTVVLAGSGEFIAVAMARRCPATAEARVVSFNEVLGTSASVAARRCGGGDAGGRGGMMPSRLIVAKVGGSLYDLPTWGAVRTWLAAEGDARCCWCRAAV
jgi:hypothetical protein